MKKLLTAVFALIASAIFLQCSFPQKTAGLKDDHAPMRTGTIVVQTGMDAEEAYRHIAGILQARGYTFRSSDQLLRNMNTEFIGVSRRRSIDYTFARIGAHIEDGPNARIVLRGWFRASDSDDYLTGQRIRKYGVNGSHYRNAWAELFMVASLVDGTMSFYE